MLESVASTMTDPNASQIAWSHSRADIVDGVEMLLSAIAKQGETGEQLLESIEGMLKSVAEAAGEEIAIPFEENVEALKIELFAIIEGYALAKDDVKRRQASVSFCEGLVLGVMSETPDNVHDYLWQNDVDPSSDNAKTEQLYHNGGMALGYMQGKEIANKGLGAGFWADVSNQLPGESLPPADSDDQNWDRGGWIDFYIRTGTAFYRGHVTE